MANVLAPPEMASVLAPPEDVLSDTPLARPDAY